MHFTRLCDNDFHDYGSPGKVVAIFDLCKWGRKNAPKTCVPILYHLVCEEVCMYQIIYFYPNLQCQALFELLTAPLKRSMWSFVGTRNRSLAHFRRDNVIKWKHLPRYWLFVWRFHRSPNSPHKGQWRGALMFSLICAWINNWVINRKAGDLRRHRAHYDVIVMYVCSRIHWFGAMYVSESYQVISCILRQLSYAAQQ